MREPEGDVRAFRALRSDGEPDFAAWDIALAQSAASARHFLGLTSEQSLYNLAVHTIELELIPAVRALGIGLIAYSPLHAGILSGALQNGNVDPRIPGASTLGFFLSN